MSAKAGVTHNKIQIMNAMTHRYAEFVLEMRKFAKAVYYRGAALALAALIIGPGSASLKGEVAAGGASGFHIDADGTLFAWGANGDGQLGDGTTALRPSPVIPESSGPWRTIAASPFDQTGAGSSGHTLGIKEDGTLWAWGRNDRGQLGLGDIEPRLTPVRVSSDDRWVAVAAGRDFSAALNNQGHIFVWGDNQLKQLGGATGTSFSKVPLRLPDKDGDAPNNDTFVEIAAGSNHLLAIHGSSATADLGVIYAWGANADGQLGLGHQSEVSSPTPLSGGTWRSVRAGARLSFAINAMNGRLFAWGSGPFGSLGTGKVLGTNIQQSDSPTATVTALVPSMPYDKVVPGATHTLAIGLGGESLFGTGQDSNGQLGLPSNNTHAVFQQIPLALDPGVTIVDVAAGTGFSLVSLSDGTVLSVGRNDSGQLGNGTTTGTNSLGSTALGAVDLSVDSINLVSNPDSLSPGGNVVFDIIIRNEGTGTVEAGTGGAIRVALSPQAIFNAEGELNFDDPVTLPLADPLSPGAALSVRVDATLPAVIPTGDYRVLVDLDTNDELEESNEGNNFGVTETPDDLLEFRADLQVDLVDASLPGSIQAGDSFDLEVDFINTGNGSLIDGAGNGFEYQLILSESADPFAGTNFELIIDKTLSEFPFESALSAGAAPERRTVRVTVPENVTLGDYFVGVLVDSTDRIAELDETNNTDFSASGSFTVTGLSIRQALDLPEPAADDPGTPTIDESVPVALSNGGDASWFGKVDASAINGDSLSSPALAAGQFAALTFEFDQPREVSFRWKAETSSSQNRLFFGANRVPLKPESQSAPESLSGLRDWSEVSFIVPADTPVGLFYEQAVAGDGDRVFVDELRVTNPAIDKPDYVIDDIQFEAGAYMLQRDRLTVTVSGINRGANFDLPNDFTVSVWLSRDTEAGNADDVFLGDLNAFQILNNGAEFVYRASFVLPEALADADYFVLARVDSNVVDGVDTGGKVDEFNEALLPFSDTDNNFAFSDEAGLAIIRAADLRVTRLVGSGELPIFVGGPADDPEFDPAAEQGEQTVFGTFIIAPLPGEQSELQIRFDVVNEGLSPVEAQDYSIRIFMAPNRDTSLEDATTLFEFVETSGLAVGGGKTFEITTSIPAEVAAGSFYLVGVQIDALDEIPESDEIDNITRSEENNVFVGEVPLEVALNDLLTDKSIQSWSDGFPGTIEGSNSASPWFGQSGTVQLDSAQAAAAQSGPVPIGGRSVMETQVSNNNNPRLVSFFWKVSSQLDLLTGNLDILQLEIIQNGVVIDTVGPIAGEVDWTRVSYELPASNDPYTLRWSYIESGDGVRGGSDAGWVDNFSAQAPDFVPQDLVVTTEELVGVVGDGVLEAGDKVQVTFNAANISEGNFDRVNAQIRLSGAPGTTGDLDWRNSNAGDIVVLASERIDVNASFSREFILDDTISLSGTFFIGVWLDDQLSIAEDDESNNLLFAELPIEIRPAFTFDEALDINLALELGDARSWLTSGDKAWFAGAGEPGDPDDLVLTPEINDGDTATIERLIEGPLILQFDWREASATSSQNRLFVHINGKSISRDFDSTADEAGSTLSITGAGFVEESILIPAGLQNVSFIYEVNDAAGAPRGSAAIDNMRVIPIPSPSPSPSVDGEADFAIVDVDFNPQGEGLTNRQTYALERDRFSLNVTALNRGADPVGLALSDVELEVRLSSDQEFDETDFVIGNLAPTQFLEGGQRLVYSGDFDLPLNIEPRDYFLLLRVRALDDSFQEITLNGTELLVNNEFASENGSVRIIRLPRLLVAATRVENEKVFYPKEDIRFSWELENIGLGDIPAESGMTQLVELWTFPPGTTEFVIGNAEKILDISEVVEDSPLFGRVTANSPEQSIIRYNQVFKLPSQARLLQALGTDGVTDDSEDLSADVLQGLSELEGFQFFFVLKRDTSLEQSSNLSLTAMTSDRFVVSPFPHDAEELDFTQPTKVDFDLWRDFTQVRLDEELTAAGAVLPDGQTELTEELGSSGIPYFNHYAYNLPLSQNLSTAAYNLSVETDAISLQNNRAYTTAAGENRVEITFPMLRGATDIRYVVQREENPAQWDTIFEVVPPFLDAAFGFEAGFVGNRSLTDMDTGLLANDEVVAVVDNNYSATITVRSVSDKPLRVIALPKVLAQPQRFVLKQFQNVYGLFDLRDQSPTDDRDGDGVSNIAELQLGTNPTVASSGAGITDLEAFVAERFALDFALFGESPPGNIRPMDDRDGDGVSNIAEILLGKNPTQASDGSTINPLDVFVVERFALDFGVFDTPVPADIGASDDFDGDGVSNLIELLLASDPTDQESGTTFSALEIFVAETMALEFGAFGSPMPGDISVSGDFDLDGISNIAELQLDTDPTDSLSGAAISPLTAFVAERFALNHGIFGFPAPANLEPDGDFDGDVRSNLAELQLGSDPTDADSGTTITELDGFIAERFAIDFGLFSEPSPSNLGLFDDQDGDGVSNLAEIQLGTDPTNASDGSSTNPTDAFVAEQFALLGRFNPLPARTAPNQDFDFDNVSNIAELQLGFDPTDPDDAPADSLSPTSRFIAERFAQQGVLNTTSDNIFAASLKQSSDFDGDGESNLMELALGGDMTLAGVTRIPIQLDMDGTDFVITYVRLKASLQPDGLSIFVECTNNMSEAWEQVPDVGSTESLATGQSGIAEDLERVELRVDTTQIDCNFFRISVEDLLSL